MRHRFARAYFRLPIRKVSKDDRNINNVTNVGPGEIVYTDTRGKRQVRAPRATVTDLDEEAAREGFAMRDLDRTDANGVRQNRVRGR